MQKKLILIINFIFLLAVLFTAGGIPVEKPANPLLPNQSQKTTAEGWSLTKSSIDIIVMVDISASMNPYFADVTDFFLNNLLKNSLRLGDNFYFLSFSGLPEVQVEAKNVDQNSVDNIINKLHLLQPIGLYTDLIMAVDFLNSFTSKLEKSRPKLILLLTDGVHDPEPGSINDIGPAEVLDKLLAKTKEIKRNGWAIHILEVPATDLKTFTLPDRANDKLLIDNKLDKRNTTNSTQIQPTVSATGNQQSTDNTQKPSYLDVLADEWNTKAIPYQKNDEKTVNKLQEDISNLRDKQEEGANNEKDKLHTQSSSARQQSAKPLFTWDPTTWVNNAGNWFSQIWIGPNSSYSWLILLFIVLALLIITLFFIFFRMRLPSLQRTFRIGKPFKQKHFTRQQIADGLIEMKVDMQNTNIGFRNIHALAPHSSRSVGGGFSHFLIFLVPFPSRIAKIRYDGTSYSFIPLKKEYFPDLDSEIPDCLNKNISARSKKGFPITICFRRYVSPLTEINRIFSQIIDATKKRSEEKVS